MSREQTPKRKSHSAVWFLLLLGVILALLFRDRLFVPSNVGFSNDGPLGETTRIYRGRGMGEELDFPSRIVAISPLIVLGLMFAALMRDER